MPISLKVRFHGIILDQRGDKRDEKVVEGKGGIPGDPHDELLGSLGAPAAACRALPCIYATVLLLYNDIARICR